MTDTLDELLRGGEYQRFIDGGWAEGRPLYELVKQVVEHSVAQAPRCDGGAQTTHFQLYDLDVHYWIETDITIYDHHEIWALPDVGIDSTRQIELIAARAEHHFEPPPERPEGYTYYVLVYYFVWAVAHHLTWRLEKHLEPT